MKVVVYSFKRSELYFPESIRIVNRQRFPAQLPGLELSDEGMLRQLDELKKKLEKKGFLNSYEHY